MPGNVGGSRFFACLLIGCCWLCGAVGGKVHGYGQQGERVDKDDRVEVYLSLLGKAGAVLPEEERQAARRQVAQMILLLPESVLKKVVRGNVRTLEGRLREDWRILPGAGAVLLAWWRAQDPLPSTPRNERLEEHLRRVAYADRHYAAPETLTGWDDRGVIYVRLDAPATKKTVQFTNPRLVRILEKTTTPIRLQDFPDNEVWVYDEIEESIYYLFVEQDGRYVLASSEDLIPRSLRLASGRRTTLLLTDVPPGKTEVLMEAMRAIYQELAPYHPDFGEAYVELAVYLDSESDQDGVPAQRAESERKFPVHLYAQNRLIDMQVKEDLALLTREETVPRQRSKVLEEVRPFPAVARVARFLDPDGTTRTEVYWSVPAATGVNYRLYERFLLTVSTSQRLADYTTRVAQRKQQTVRTVLNAGAESVLPVQTLVMRGDTARYHVAVQWDQYPLIGEGDATRKASDEPVRRGVFRADSLQALQSRPDVLEMSDLVPVVASEGMDLDGDDGRPALSPYPFSTFSRGDSLGLYFEVYHLAFGADDRTRFFVEYEVRRREAGGLFRLFQDRQTRTSARTRYAGRTRTAREWIGLALEEGDKAADVEVVVRVTDETTHQVTERSVVLRFVPPDR
ncbi:MAG: GWxTD domain-containing protein [Rhodothermales bacterium]